MAASAQAMALTRSDFTARLPVSGEDERAHPAGLRGL
jgi:hypothetical protein